MPVNSSTRTSTPEENDNAGSPNGDTGDDSDDDNPEKDCVDRNHQFSPPTSFTVFAAVEAVSHVARATRRSFCSVAVKPLAGTFRTT